jgi:L-lactate dehydrogenase complex protein LldG
MLNEQNKRAFLHGFSLALGRDSIPDQITPFDYSKGPSKRMMSEVQTPEETVERFKHECDLLSIKYAETTPEGLKDIIMDVIDGYGGGKVIYPSVDQIKEYGLDKVFADNEGKDGHSFIAWDPNKGREVNIANAQDASIGITFPQMAIAETATLVQPMTSGSGRSVGLLPITHLAILRRSTIHRRMIDTMEILRKQYQDDPAGFPSAVVHISGPSSTSDIELVRVVGVHGPVNITYIIVND